jgi:hypothetical protein
MRVYTTHLRGFATHFFKKSIFIFQIVLIPVLYKKYKTLLLINEQ